MLPLPVKVEEGSEGEETASASTVATEDVSPAQQLDLFPVEQKREL
jgi:hypothetical protein